MNLEKYLPTRDIPDMSPSIDLAMLALGKHADRSKASKLAGRSAEELIDDVMRRAKVDLGGNCSLVKCPQSSKPAACLLFPFKNPETGREEIYCSGPCAIQKEKKKLLGGKKTTYDYRSPYSSCPYFLPEESKVHDKATLILSQLDNYPDDWENQTISNLGLEDIEF